MRSRWLALALASGACASAVVPPAGGDAPAPDSWAAQMRTVKAQLQRVERALCTRPQGDLVAAAHEAREAAATLRLGYGAAEDRTIPGYAAMARQAEAWLLQVALDARSGHGELAAEQFALGLKQHCTACHEAVERAATRSK